MRSKLMLAKGRDMWIVTQADTQDAYLPLRESLTLTGYAAYVLELLDRFTYEEGQNAGLYQLLTDTLERLVVVNDTFVVVRYYELHLLDLLGFRPSLNACVNCGRPIQPQDQFFNARMGGVLCPDCGARTPGSRPVSMAALKYLRHFQRSSFAQALRAQIPDATRGEMEALLSYYITFLLERGLNAPTFIRKVSQD
jgi:DNA repair protein RecO (recombination protein O)